LRASKINNTIRYDVISAFLCLSFAIVTLFLTLAPGDGTWILYGDQLNKGLSLYKDIKIHQQPLFPIFGKIVSFFSNNKFLYEKLFFSTFPIAFIYTIYKISTKMDVSFLKRGLFIAGIFFCSIRFVAYRFDDYHIVSSFFAMCSVYISIKYIQRELSASSYIYIQSFIASLALFNRVNDGFFLFLIVYGIYLYNEKNLKNFILNLLKSLVIAFFILSLLLIFSKATYVDWFNLTIAQAGKIKGGTQLFSYPFLMLQNSFNFVLTPLLDFSRNLLGLFFIVYTLSYLFLRSKLTPSTPLIRFIFISNFILFFYLIYRIYQLSFLNIFLPFIVIISFFALILYVWTLFKMKFLEVHNTNIMFCLILYPAFLFLSGSLSSAGGFNDHYFPMATMLAVTPFIFEKNKNILRHEKNFFYLACLVLALNGLVYRISDPYSWHSYHIPKFFNEYKVSFNSQHGYFFTNKELSSLIDPVCPKISNSDTLLSIPFSFANYYCGVEPWNGYIQTFFDTSSKSDINDLVINLKKTPPSYIFYQRQLFYLGKHEEIFNKGLPLPHRKLDNFLMEKITRNEWFVVYKSQLYPPSEWMLISTQK
jgi:hypothetical protein